MRLIFMGTPEFAVPSLAILLKNGFEIAAVVTAPDKPAGRGLKLSQSPVKLFAQTHQLNILQPVKLRDESFLKELQTLQPDAMVVVAFRMLPEQVWSLPPQGTINLHASLLPDYRGAAPINHAIINGETETGLTTFFIEKEIDTGQLIFQKKINISPDETAGELHDRMMFEGAELVLKTMNAIRAGNAPRLPQPKTGSEKIAPKLTREGCRINWTLPAHNIYNFIRGLSPYPCAWTMLENKVLKIFRAQLQLEHHSITPGKIFINKHEFKIAATDGFIHPLEVQLEGRKRMAVKDFLAGLAGK